MLIFFRPPSGERYQMLLAQLVNLCTTGRCGGMACRHAARESDLEQPLLDGGSKSDLSSSTAQNGHARSEASEAAESELEAAAPARAAPSVWRDPVLPATLAAVLCLWVLKLVQQGYVDGAFLSAYLRSFNPGYQTTQCMVLDNWMLCGWALSAVLCSH